MTPEESLAKWQCCASMEEHLEHLAHLERVHAGVRERREQMWKQIGDLVAKLRESIEENERKQKLEKRKHLRLITGGKK